MRRIFCFIIFLFLALLTLNAQSISNSNLSTVTADQVTDEQLMSYQKQLESSNLSMPQLEQLLASKGLSGVEIEKLKQRLMGLQKNTSKPKGPINADRSVAPDTYKTFVKEGPDVFGSSLFNTPSLSFEPNLRIATPLNYILGPDDELIVNVSGYQETNLNLTVQPEGFINIPQVGSINVAGLSFNDATAKIRSKMAATAYATIKSGQTKVNITLGKIRSIHITVIGASKPGNYTVSSLTTVFNSLFLCGGPGEINTYREIELLRNNKVYQKIDLYQFLTKGNQSGNVILQENDVINFPIYKKRVSIIGEVKRTGVFELTAGESLSDLLYYAGNFTNRAFKAIIKVKQITDTEKRIKDVLKENFSSYIPNNGDDFKVDAILDRVDNAVSINGGIYRPGEFELTPNLNLKELIERAGGLVEGVYLNKAILTRTKEDLTLQTISLDLKGVMNGVQDIQLIKGDKIQIAVLNDFRETYNVSIEGEVRKAGVYPYSENLTLKDLFFLAGGLTDAGSSYHLEVSRRITSESEEKPTNVIAKVFQMNIEREVELMSDNFLLAPNDIVTVRKNPGYLIQKKVTISGEVNFPGSYTLQSKSENILDLIKRAGGLTAFANEKGISLIRNNPISEIVKKDKANKVEAIQSSIRDSSKAIIQEVVNPTSKIAIDYQTILKDPASNENYSLLDGDNIEIPLFDPLVKINGEVLMPTKTNFEEGKSIRYYLQKSGGTTDDARKSKIFVIYANGDVDKTNNGLFGLLRSYPTVEAGTEIIIPAKRERRKFNTAETVGITSGLVSLITLVLITINSLK